MNSHFFVVLLVAGAVPAYSQTMGVRAEKYDGVYKIGETVCIVATLKEASPKLERGDFGFRNKGGGLPFDAITFENRPDGSYKLCGKIASSALEGEYTLGDVNLVQTNFFGTHYGFDTDFKEVISIKVQSEVKKLPEIKRLELVK